MRRAHERKGGEAAAAPVDTASGPLPGLAALEVFEALARHGSFTRAARELGVSQSAVSHRMKDLEGTLGVRLLARSRPVVLTREGERLVEAARDGLGRVRAALDEIRRAGDERPVTLGCTPSFAVKWLVPRLDDLRARHPGLEVWISAGDDVRDPAARGLEGAIHYGEDGGPGAVRLGVEHVFPVAHPDVAAGLRVPADLAGATLLIDAAWEGHPARADWAAWLAAAGVGHLDPHAGPRFSHAHLALASAAAGQGVALARSSLVDQDLEAGRLVRPFAVSVQTGLAYWWVPGASDRPAVRAFRDWLVGALSLG